MIVKSFFQCLLWFLSICSAVSLVEIVLVVHTIGINTLPLQSLLYNAFLKSIPSGCIAALYCISILWKKTIKKNKVQSDK